MAAKTHISRIVDNMDNVSSKIKEFIYGKEIDTSIHIRRKSSVVSTSNRTLSIKFDVKVKL